MESFAQKSLRMLAVELFGLREENARLNNDVRTLKNELQVMEGHLQNFVNIFQGQGNHSQSQTGHYMNPGLQPSQPNYPGEFSTPKFSNVTPSGTEFGSNFNKNGASPNVHNFFQNEDQNLGNKEMANNNFFINGDYQPMNGGNQNQIPGVHHLVDGDNHPSRMMSPGTGFFVHGDGQHPQNANNDMSHHIHHEASPVSPCAFLVDKPIHSRDDGAAQSEDGSHKDGDRAEKPCGKEHSKVNVTPSPACGSEKGHLRFEGHEFSDAAHQTFKLPITMFPIPEEPPAIVPNPTGPCSCRHDPVPSYTPSQPQPAGPLNFQREHAHAPPAAPKPTEKAAPKLRPFLRKSAGGSGASRYWQEDEHERFLEGLKKFGRKDLKAIAGIVKTRNHYQVRSHLQKYILREQKEEDIEASPSEAAQKGAQKVVVKIASGAVPTH